MSISSELLESGLDYPFNWVDFINWFPDHPACLSFLKKLRWPEEFVCPRCNWKGDPYVGTRNRLLCSKCRHQTSITAGTLFEKTRTALTCWFAAAWYITNEKHGVGAHGLRGRFLRSTLLTFHEDESLIYAEDGAKNMALFRRMLLNLAKAHLPKGSMASKLKKSGLG